MITKKVKKIDEATVLIPELIADNVLKEVQELTGADYSSLNGWLCERAETIFQNNKKFAKELKKDSGRDYLWMFMRHWIFSKVTETDKNIIDKKQPQYRIGVYNSE